MTQTHLPAPGTSGSGEDAEERRPSRRGRRAAVIVGLVALLATAGIAFAAWLASGTGSGQVTSTQAVNSVITPAANGTALYPGATTDFTVTVTNPNAYPVTVTQVFAGSSDEIGGCAAGTVTSAAVAPNTAIAPNATGTVTLSATMNPGATDACQNKVFSLPLNAQLASNG